MSHPARPARLLALLLLLAGVAVLGFGLAAHAQKGKEEEEDKNPPTKTKPRPKVEEEDTSAKKPTRRVTAPDDGVKKPARPAAIPETTDLVTAARQAKNPAVREFLESVAVPHDIVVNPRVIKRVAPVDKYLGQDPPRFAGSLTLHPLDEEWNQEKPWSVNDRMLTGVKYYEQTALSRVDEFLEKPLDSDPNRRDYVSRPDMLHVAETVLSAVLTFHDSQRAQGKREGEAFDTMEAKVKKRLFDVQLDELNLFVDGNDWDNAFAMAKRLADAYPKPEDHKVIADLLAKVISKAAEAGNYNDEQLLALRAHLKQLQERFPNATALGPIDDRLKAQADSLFQRAQNLVEKAPGERNKALEMLRRAEEIYPRLPGLHDYRLRLDNALAVLRVGVRRLPVNLSPNLAYTDAEKQAVELLFEGLVKVSYAPDGSQYYVPGLAEGQPVVLPLGRQFHIARDAYWSNDQPVTAADVRNTLRLLKDPKWSGFDPTWKELVEDMRLSNDPSRVSLTLTQGVFDPLALMTFKVLPEKPWPGFTLNANEEEKFATKPVGSGPYQLDAALTGGRYVTFTASPSYGSRPGKLGLPHIRQVQFVQGDDPVGDLLAGKVDLVTDVPTDRLAALQGPNSPVVVLPPMPNRRIYFLAANGNRFALQSPAMRKAIAHAIDRNKILDDVFRAGQKGVHKALNGPYPPDSWACDPNQGYRLSYAKSFYKEAEQAGAANKVLTLKYPDDDPRVGKAMRLIHDQVKAEIGVDLQLKPLPPDKLREQVEGSHDYDLAYYHYDYASDAYWLWPLFDPEAIGARQSNFLSYKNDGDLLQQFGRVKAFRDPEKVQTETRLLHRILFEKMPLIPLWQLDTHVAMSPALKPTPFDPLLVFTDVEQWKLEKK
jgi:peptide/nickel transport system substrate-binding protein